MSLYADLDQNGKKDKDKNIDGWGSNMKMLETQKKLQQSRQLGFNKIKKPGGASIAPVHDLNKQSDDNLQLPYSFNSSTGRMEQETVVNKSQEELDEAADNASDKVAIGEYDPLRPNEYHAVLQRIKYLKKSYFAQLDKPQPPLRRQSGVSCDSSSSESDPSESSGEQSPNECDDREVVPAKSESRGHVEQSDPRYNNWETARSRGDYRGRDGDRDGDRDVDRDRNDFRGRPGDGEATRDGFRGRGVDYRQGADEFRGRSDDRGSGDYRNRDEDRNHDIFRGQDNGRQFNDSRTDLNPNSQEHDEGRSNNRGGAAIAPPSFLQISDPPSKKPNKVNIASKIMAKMGYKHGQGLGKEEQGMAKPLVVEKTSKTSCKILHENNLAEKVSSPDMMAGLPLDFIMPPTPPGGGQGGFAAPLAPPPPMLGVPQYQDEFAVPGTFPAEQQPPASNASLMSNPTRVILLRNMVSPGEVDEELEEETASECSKYGKVVKCTISENFLMNNEEGVRVFLQFEKVDSAIKAVIDLNGRFFGGRSVRATFYDVDDFKDMKFDNDA